VVSLANDAGVVGALRAHALRAVRQFAWLEVGSVKRVLSRPGRARDGTQSRPLVPRRTAATRRAGHTHRVLTQTQAVGRCPAIQKFYKHDNHWIETIG
jgi:hypothetical protein